MALNFQPPEWLIREYMARKQPAEIASEGIQQGLGAAVQLQAQSQAQKQAALANYLKLIEIDPELTKTPIGQQLQGQVGGGLQGYQPPSVSTPTAQPVDQQVAGTTPNIQGAATTTSPIIGHFNSFFGRGKLGEKAQGQIKTGLEAQKLALGLSDQPIYDATGKKVGTAPANAHFLPPGALPPKPPAPPPGFRYSADGQSLEAIPGGPAAIKQAEVDAKEQGLKNAAIQQADRVMAKVDDALLKVSGTTTGFVGSIAGKVAGTPAYNLRQDIDTIKANLGFRELQEMRRNSPTGGALGQIAVRELDFLQATIASLDPNQSPHQIKQNLGEIKASYQRWRDAVSGQGSDTSPQPQQGGGLDNTPTVEDGYAYTPGPGGRANQANWRPQ